MKNFILLFLVLSSCQKVIKETTTTPQPSPIVGPKGDTGETGAKGDPGINGSSCSTQQISNGSSISCTDGTFSYVYNGTNGLNGTNGSSCSVSGNSTGATVSCTDGSFSQINNGLNGAKGDTGSNGTGCNVVSTNNGALVTCGAQSVAILNGTNAPTTIGIAGYIKPCGPEFANDEIFLRLTDGNILAHYDGGTNQNRLVLLAPGNYQTTDRSNHTCAFTITNNLQIINEHIN
jgi:hypothetical protein